MKKKSGIILSALPLLTLGLCFISNSSFANGVNAVSYTHLTLPTTPYV